MTFNEWRHRQTSYDRRMSAARTQEAQRAVMEAIAMQAMQIAVQKQDKAFAASVLGWAIAKGIVQVAA